MIKHKELSSRTPNNGETVTHRRELVARLRIRGLSQREIMIELAKVLLNPHSGSAFTLGTIAQDCLALDKQWRERTATSIDGHKARVLSSLMEVERAAWAAKDLNGVLRALKQECDLLGLDAPAQYDLYLRQEARRVAEHMGMTEEDVLAGVQDILRGRT